MQRTAAALTPLKKRSKAEFGSKNAPRDPVSSGSILNSNEWRVVKHNIVALLTLLLVEIISPLRRGIVETLARFRLDSYNAYIFALLVFLFMGNIIWTYISAIWSFYTQENLVAFAEEASDNSYQQKQTVPTPKSLLVSPRQKVNIKSEEYSTGYILGSSPPKASKSPSPPSLSVPWTTSTAKIATSTQVDHSNSALKSKAAASSPYLFSQMDQHGGGKPPFILSNSPLPDTGSERVDQEVRSSIGVWTAKLMAAIKFEGRKEEGEKELTKTSDSSLLPSRIDSKVVVRNITIIPAEKVCIVQ